MERTPERDLHLPADGEPAAVALVLHPHPAMGGDRHHPLCVALCERLAARGVAASRIDIPDPDTVAAATTLSAAATALAEELEVERIVLAGYSWGSLVAAAADPPGVVARVLVAPPASMVARDPIAGPQPVLALVPAHDQYGSPDQVRALLGDRPQTETEVVEGADHFLLGAVARIADRATDWLIEALDVP